MWVNMSRFRGRYDYTIDEKGRVNIPAKFRKLLTPEADETFVICRAPDGCLWAYPLDEWEKFEEKLDAMPPSRETHKFQRKIQNSLTDSRLDKQGRVTVSPLQMRIGGIEKDVVVLGRGRYVELWSKQRFEEYTEPDSDFDEMYYNAVSGLGD